MSLFRRSISVLAVASAVALVPTAPSWAASGTGTDPTGDAPSAVDVTNLAISNSLTKVDATVTLANNVPASGDSSWVENGGTNLLEVLIVPNQSESTEMLAFTYTGSQAKVVSVDTANDEPSATAVCDATANVTGPMVAFSADAKCFGTPARIDAYGLYGNPVGVHDLFVANGTNVEPTPVTAQVYGGQYLLGADGGVFSLGDAPFYGSTGDLKLNQPVVSMAKNPTGQGYWFAASDGGVFTYGPGTQFYGSKGGSPLNAPIVGMAPTPSGKGYWLVAADGGIFTYGDAAFFGSKGGMPLNAPVIGMAATPSGNGYYLYAADGGVFTFGAANFYGSTGDLKLNKPITGMALNPSGTGYWFVAEDGGIFTFGTNTNFYGSAGDDDINQMGISAVGIVADGTGNGYRLILDNGVVVPYGNIYNYGDLRDQNIDSLNAPIVGGVNNVVPI